MLKRNDLCAIRVGKGCAKTPPLTCYDDTYTMYWYLGQSLSFNIQSTGLWMSNGGQANWAELEPDTWTNIRFLQALISHSCSGDKPADHCEDSKEETLKGSSSAQSSDNTIDMSFSPGGPLPDIMEEDSADSYFNLDGELNEDMVKALQKANHALYLDALSVFASITATFIKTPADNGVLVHCLYLRELLDNDVLYALIWVDTRDMTSDGFTKGAVDRKALHDLMDGRINLEHACKAFRAKHLIKTTPGK